MLGTVHIDILPVGGYYLDRDCVVDHGDGTLDYCTPFDHNSVPEVDGVPLIRDISECLPFGSYTLGGLCARFTDFTPSITGLIPRPSEDCSVGDPVAGPYHCGHWYDCQPCHRCGDDTVDLTCDCDRCSAARDRLACPFPFEAPDRPCFTTINPTETR